MVSRIVKFMEGNTIAMIALFIALGGTATAATTLAANSVGSKQLKKNAVTTAKIKNKAVTGAKIKAGTITGDKLAAGTITGDKINVSTLPKVPSAANADTLGGVSKAVWGTALEYPGIAFAPRSSGSATWQYGGFGNVGIQLLTGGGFFVKAVQLPQGATVTNVTMYYDNTVAGTSGSLWFSREALSQGATGETDYGPASSGSVSGYSSVSFAPNIAIDNATYTYMLYWLPGTVNNIFGGAKIEYTLPGATAGPRVHAMSPALNGPGAAD